MQPPIEQFIARSPRPRVQDYFSQGFNIVFQAPLLFILAGIVFLGINIGFSVLPLGGLIFSLLIQPALIMGFFIAADKVNYLETINFSNFFDGLSGGVGKLLLTNLLKFIIVLVPLVLAVIGLVSIIGADAIMEMATATTPEEIEDIELHPEFSASNLAMFFIGLLIAMYLSISYLFALLMLRFKSLGIWQSLEASRKLVAKHFGHFILFALFAALVNLAGALLLIVGLLVTIPATYAAIYVAFDDMVGARADENTDKLMDHLIDPTV